MILAPLVLVLMTVYIVSVDHMDVSVVLQPLVVDVVDVVDAANVANVANVVSDEVHAKQILNFHLMNH